MTSRLVALKHAISSALAGLPEVRDVQPFGKLIEAEDISRLLFKSPCAFVSLLASPGGEPLPAGDSRTRIDVVAAIVAKGRPGVPDDEETLATAEAVYKAARWAQFGDTVWPAEGRRMEIVPVPGRMGVAVLAVRWSHFIVLDDADTDPDEDVFELDPGAVATGTLREGA